MPQNSWYRSPSNIMSLIALVVSIVGTTWGIYTSQRSLNLSEDAANKVDQSTVDGRIIGPTELTDELCYRFHGYHRNLPGTSSLWIVLHAVGDTTLYATRVDSKYRPSVGEVQAAKNLHSSSSAWVTPVQIGDDANSENSETYVVDLYYADTVQSKELFELSKDGVGMDALPAGVEAHHLGQALELTHPPHVAVPHFTCSMDNARG